MFRLTTKRPVDPTVNFERILHLFPSVSIVDFEQVNVSQITSLIVEQ